jgi:hypothetical protein
MSRYIVSHAVKRLDWVIRGSFACPANETGVCSQAPCDPAEEAVLRPSRAI